MLEVILRCNSGVVATPEAVRGHQKKIIVMTINDKHVTSQAQGNLNTVLGAVGSAGALLGGNGLLGNLLGNRNGCECSDNQPISRYEANLLLALNNKDAEIANLKSDQYTDAKIVEATTYLQGLIRQLEAEVRKNKEEQCSINTQQAVYNGANTATLQCMQNQIQQLFGLTKLVVPNTAVCPGWGDVAVTPKTTTTTPAA